MAIGIIRIYLQQWRWLELNIRFKLVVKCLIYISQSLHNHLYGLAHSWKKKNKLNVIHKEEKNALVSSK